MARLFESYYNDERLLEIHERENDEYRICVFFEDGEEQDEYFKFHPHMEKPKGWGSLLLMQNSWERCVEEARKIIEQSMGLERVEITNRFRS